MDERSISYLLGIIVGLLVGLIAVAAIMKMTKKNGKIKREYDERQSLIRGKGIAWGFLTLVICNVLYAVMTELNIELPMVPSVAVVAMIFISVAVMIVHFIWHDVYFGLNERRERVMIAFVWIALFNLVVGIRSVADGRAIKDGRLTVDSINLFCAGLFAVVFVALLVKRAVGEDD